MSYKFLSTILGIDANFTGRIGVGTITPNANLEVVSSVGITTMLVGRAIGNSSIRALNDAGGGFLALDSANVGAATIINHYTSDNIWLVTGGGNVGIGTTSPNAKLDVNGGLKYNFGVATSPLAAYTSTTGGLYTYYSSPVAIIAAVSDDLGTGTYLDLYSGSNRAIRITPSTNVLIGTTTDAGYKLDVNSSLQIAKFNGTSGSGGYITLQKQSSDIFYFGPSTAISGLGNNVDLWGVSGYGVSLYSNGNPSNNLTLTTSGNVGIGTVSPTYKLVVRNDVDATTSLDPTTIKLYNNSDGGSGIEFSNGVGGNSKISFGVQSSGAGTDDTYLGFSTGTNASIAERMRVAANGNVGIGTTNPIGKLQVAGTSGNLLTVGTLTNDWVGDIAMGVTNGNGVIISKLNTANDTNRVLVFYRDDTNGATIWGYQPNGTTIGYQIRANAFSYFNGGNVLIGTTTDAGYKLDVNGNSRIKGSGSTSATTTFRVENSSGGSPFTILGDGTVNMSLNANLTYNLSCRAIVSNGGYGAVGVYLSSQNYGNSAGTATTIQYTGSPAGVTSNGLVIGGVALQSATYNALAVNQSFTGLGTNTLIGYLFDPTLDATFPATNIISIKTTKGNVQLATLSGNVLIGTTTDAGYKLDVNGTGRFASGVTSTGLIVNGTEFYYAPANYTSGGFSRLLGRNSSTGRIEGMSAADVQAFIGLSGYISGSGSTNYIPKFTGSTSVGNSLLYDDGTNVGIGTTTPFNNAKLQIRPANNANIAFQPSTALSSGIKINAFNDAASVNVNLEINGLELAFKTGEAERMRIASSGNVLIGTTTDAGYKLQVVGGAISLNQSGQNILFANNAASGTSGYNIFIGNGGANVSGSSYQGSYNTSLGYDALRLNNAGYSNVAIGYGAMLNNTIGADNTSVGTQSLGSNTTGSRNTSVGSASLYDNTTGVNNTSVGFLSLRYSNGNSNTSIGTFSSYANTTGSNNTSLGFESLYYNTIGNENTAIGYQSMRNNASGNYNTAIGYASLIGANNDRNTAIGYLSLAAITSGSLNTAIGMYSGYYSASGGGYSITNTNSVFLGYQAKSSADGNTNEIVIGYDADGQGSNSAVLGNSSISKTVLRGNVLIGTTTDAGYRLQVEGNERINNGFLTINAPSLGYTQYDYSQTQDLYTYTGNSEVIELGRLRTTNGSDWSSNGFRMQAKVDSTYMAYVQFNGNNNNFGLSFGTGGSSSRQGISERMRITSDGNVGINNSSPDSKLVVAGPLGSVIGTSGSTIKIINTDTGNYASITAGITGITNDGMQFSTDGVARAVISGTGNVGIGTTTPQSELDIYRASNPAILLRDSSAIARLLPYAGNVYFQTAQAFSGGSTADLYFTGMYGTPVNMLIKSTGNVLIGTTTDPGYKLRVNGNASIENSTTIENGALYVSAGSGTNYSSILSTSYNYPYVETYLDSYAGSSYEGRLIFRTNSGGGALSAKLTIANSGATTVANLAGSGTRMVVADSGGTLSTQAIPGGGSANGSWQENSTQTAPANNTGVGVKFSTLNFRTGVNVIPDSGGQPTLIQMVAAGRYDIQFSFQFENADNAAELVYVWLRKNGENTPDDIPDSNTMISVPAKHGSIPGKCVAAWNFFVEANAGDFFQLAWATADATNVSMPYYAATGFCPATPSAILTVNQVN